MTEAGERFSRRVQVVAGKGGVGRTAVSCALALRSARAGQRTLLLEVNAPDDAAAFLGVAPAVDEPREVVNNLWLCRMTPEGAMREYALMVLKFKALYNLVFENRMVKYLLRSIPSLAEFTMLGKTWFHTTEELLGTEEPKYERIIVDAPATGHAITFLSVARIVADVTPKGIMKKAAERMAEMVESEQTCVHVVTLPEEMPVNEGLELLAAAKDRLRMYPGVGIVNRLLPPLGEAGDASLIRRLRAEGPTPAMEPYLEAAVLRLDREALQQEHAARFREESKLPSLELYDYEAQAAMGTVPHERHAENPAQVDWLDRIVEAIDRCALPASQLRRTAEDG